MFDREREKERERERERDRDREREREKVAAMRVLAAAAAADVVAKVASGAVLNRTIELSNNGRINGSTGWFASICL